MAKNSLFAILLRSPWWISFAVVALFALASGALLPQKYVVFGLMGALPFLVIGVIAALRQFRAPSTKHVEQTLQRAAAMSWRAFCDALEQGYRKQGYDVERLDAPAADLRLRKSARSTLVAAKRWKAGNHGVEPLRALDQLRRQQDASDCVYISLNDVTDATRRFAAQHQIELLNGAGLALLLGKQST